MKHSPPSAKTPGIFDQLAVKLREMVQAEHVNSLSGVERFRVVRVAPLMVEHVDGDLVLEDGDPDFTVGSWVRQRIANYGITVGDQVWCARESQEWHAFDVTSDTATAWS